MVAGLRFCAAQDATVEAVEKVMPSVVNIATETIVQVQDQFQALFGPYFAPYRHEQAQHSLGSGVIIDDEGYVLTNDHVVRRAEKIWVKVHGRDEPYSAKVVATNPRSDVALLKLNCKEGEHFKAVQFAREDDLKLGETVLALGNPFGLGESVSRGILSSKSRVTPKENDQLDVPNWLQTDASINPGNSGGPLVNLKGELIGINVAILSKGQGIGFAIPIKLVDTALSEIVTPESAGNGLWFGARMKASPLPLEVLSVQVGSPAAESGLKAGDTILNINGHEPKGLIDFNEELVKNQATNAALKVRTGNKVHDIKVRLVPEKDVFNPDMIEKMTGVRLQELDQRLAGYFGVDQNAGFVVAAVQTNSPAAHSLQPGILVTGIEGLRPENMVEAAKIFHEKKKGDKVRLNILVQRQQGAFIMKNSGMVELLVR